MAYTADLDAVHNPATGTVAPASWGDALNANAADMAAWTSYTPTWTGATTNPVIGNGTLAGFYQRRGDWLQVAIEVTFGSTTTYGSGLWYFALPSTGETADVMGGTGFLIGAANYCLVARTLSSTVALHRTDNNSQLTDANPGSNASGHTIRAMVHAKYL